MLEGRKIWMKELVDAAGVPVRPDTELSEQMKLIKLWSLYRRSFLPMS